TAIFTLNNAFMEGQVVTVIPIIAASPIFTLLMSWLIFRRERLTLKIVAAVFLVVPSVAFIAVS
ncbi:MAG: EamA family transporter, partial [Pseudomonadota bacterium]|nr:EamA family transporter [Pseudomonadota bacterium]